MKKELKTREFRLYFKIDYSCMVSLKKIFQIFGYKIANTSLITMNNQHRYVEITYKKWIPVGVTNNEIDKIYTKKVNKINKMRISESVKIYRKVGDLSDI